ncbi:hypothetical protein CONCODRAFT_79319 [Conidiobolus coronatus NRRL 28638]|uniref:Uncharacterized protein n=1 Tax=Conidiobolus coronatus (strain ATCC 28846 / CBS 209.66 / NRRL 28638) TaxID=796925 RepID=A0A137P389_CONC2|nr:hypothetical protein CONCODRAFT_79319 [Conidiobolus coronatus NRRL 28638]|eukprot:KXN69438.1 hypothetical protein CONCODRAFT_79319 [Conidiobolus coronatus NRRL 28638]
MSSITNFKDSILIRDLTQLQLIQPTLSSLKSRICGFTQPLHWLELNQIDSILIIFSNEWPSTHLYNQLNQSYFGGHRLSCRLLNSEEIMRALSEGNCWGFGNEKEENNFMDIDNYFGAGSGDNSAQQASSTAGWDPQLDFLERQILNMTLN